MFCVYKLYHHFLITMGIVDNTQVRSNISSLGFNTAPIPGHVINSVTLLFFHGEATLVKRQIQNNFSWMW